MAKSSKLGKFRSEHSVFVMFYEYNRLYDIMLILYMSSAAKSAEKYSYKSHKGGFGYVFDC